jgi:hypothetical protein
MKAAEACGGIVRLTTCMDLTKYKLAVRVSYDGQNKEAMKRRNGVTET